MAAFEYIALTVQGRKKRGIREADSPRQVRQWLREQNLAPLSIDDVSERAQSSEIGFFLQRGVSTGELALATRQLATLIQAALPVEQALLAVAEQQEGRAIRRILFALRSEVNEGHSFAQALSKFPQVFPDMYRATVEAGEQAGQLDSVLERLAERTEQRQQLGQKVMMALVYPILLTLVSVGVVIGMLVYVVPQVVDIFISRDAALPLLTQIMLDVSNFLRHQGLWLVIVLAALISAGVFLWRTPASRQRIDDYTLHIPLIGSLVRTGSSAHFAQTLSILVASGVPILHALTIGEQVVSNRRLKNAIARATEQVRQGSGISRALQEQRVFSPMLVYMIASGESSGQLEAMLNRAAHNQEREVEAQLTMIVSIIEPLIILFMGVVVSLIVLAILLPIFELNQLVTI